MDRFPEVIWFYLVLGSTIMAVHFFSNWLYPRYSDGNVMRVIKLSPIVTNAVTLAGLLYVGFCLIWVLNTAPQLNLGGLSLLVVFWQLGTLGYKLLGWVCRFFCPPEIVLKGCLTNFLKKHPDIDGYAVPEECLDYLTKLSARFMETNITGMNIYYDTKRQAYILMNNLEALLSINPENQHKPDKRDPYYQVLQKYGVLK